MKLTIDVLYAEKLSAITSAFLSKLEDLRPLLGRIGDRIRYSFQDNIKRSRSPEGQAYKPLKRPRGKGHNPNPRPLYDTGEMFDSIRYEIVGPDTVVIGEQTHYGVYQSRGTRTIPARPFIGLRHEDARDLENIIGNFTASIFAGEHGEALLQPFTNTHDLIFGVA